MFLKHFIKTHNLIYKGKKIIGPSTYTFYFEPLRPFYWGPGQYGTFGIKKDKDTIWNSFSIISNVNEKYVVIATNIIKTTENEYKKSLLKIKKGDTIFFKGPKGSFAITDYSKKYAFIATGIGITPFRAILKDLYDKNIKEVNITIFYVGNKDYHFFRDNLSEFKAKLKNLSIVYIYKPDRITGQTIVNTLSKDMFDTKFMIAGSQKMIESYERTLKGLGISNKNITKNTFEPLKTRLKSKIITDKNSEPLTH